MSVVARIAKNPWPFVVAGGVVLVGVYFLGGKLLSAIGGLFSGNNALTEGTDYEGAGIAGTLGAAVNAASGGTLQSAGESIGSGLYDLLNGNDYDGYSYSSSLHRWVQVQRRSDGKIFNVDANGNITGPA